MEFEEALLRAVAAYVAADNPEDGATGSVAIMAAWWRDTYGGTLGDLFIGASEGDGIPVPSGKRTDLGAYCEARATKCFLCEFPISGGAVLCRFCLAEENAKAQDWDDDEASQRYPALA